MTSTRSTRWLIVGLIAAPLLATAPVAAIETPAATGSAQILSVVPQVVGANSSTTVRITGSGFERDDNVAFSHCPDSNPGARYPVPFPVADQDQNPGSVEFIDSTTILVTIPDVIPVGDCDITVGDAVLADSVHFTEAPEQLTVEIVNTSDQPDSQVWVTAGYNCPLSAPSPPWPAGVDGCDTDGTINPHYAWPGRGGSNPNRFWYEVYAGRNPLPAFTGVRLSDLPAIKGRAHTYGLSVANIDSGVVYISYGEPVNVGSAVAGRAPSYLTSPTRFDVFELTFHGSGASAGEAGQGHWTNRVYANITAVAGLGILMDLAGYDNSWGVDGPAPRRIGTGISWNKDLSIRGLLQLLADRGVDVNDPRVVVTTDGKPATEGTFLRLVSPSTNEGSGYADLAGGAQSYLRWVAQQVQPMTLVGQYSGSGVGQGTWFCYRAERFSTTQRTTLQGAYGFYTRADATDAAGRQCSGGIRGGVITTASSSADPSAGPVTSSAVYMQDNRYLVDGAPPVGNDLYNAIYRDFIVSFAYGYWGSTQGSDGWNTTTWSRGQVPAFSAAWPGLSGAEQNPRWSSYAEAIWTAGNAYGMPYSDTFDNAGQGNPLVSGSSIATLRLTLHPDGDWSDQPAVVPARQRVTAVKGVRFASRALTPIGFTSPVVFSVQPSLPSSRKKARDGIWFVRKTGVIKGIPARLSHRTTYVITARSADGVSADARIRLRVVRK